MMEEIRKRPFVRPLFLWITGILLQVCFPLQQLSMWLLLPVAVVVIISLFIVKDTYSLSYDAHWLWGALIACFILFYAIQVTAYAELRLSVPAATGWLQEKAQVIQGYLVGKLNRLNLSETEKSVLAAITLNYKTMMTWEVRNQFSVTGVAHLLSVSGFHVGIVYGFLSSVLSVLPKRPVFHCLKCLLIILLLWMFAYVAGLSIPTVRATLMFTIYVTGRLLSRRPERYNTLAAAALCMLCYNPFYLFDIGFQLSFTAVFFILYLHPPLNRLIYVRNPLVAKPWGVMTVTVAAQAGTTFLCCYYFGSCSAVFLLTNIYLSLLATMLIPLALLWMFLPAGIPGSEVLQWLIEVLMKGFMAIVERFSLIPWASLPLRFDFATLLCAYGLLGLMLVYSRRLPFRRRIGVY
jgi:competence protein ComEC